MGDNKLCGDPKLGAQLRETLLNPLPKPAIYQLPSPKTSRQEGFTRYVEREGLKIQWYQVDGLSDAGRLGKLGLFIKALRSRRLILVGPEKLKPLEGDLFHFDRFVEVPDRSPKPPKDHPSRKGSDLPAWLSVPIAMRNNAWKYKDEVCSELRPILEKDPSTVVMFCAGMLSETAIYDLFEPDRTLLDIGSVFDPFAGKLSRKYMRKVDSGIWDKSRREAGPLK
jgi:hypothetical protein